MKTAGIIAEYNPFHKGHEYQIRYTKEKLKADYVIVAMSGDYVQRGTPALISKHTRAEMALRCGADLVLEMPVSISTASAEAFAMGGVSLLDGLGVVDMLCFGSESGEISALKELAEILVEEPEEYKKLLKSFLSEGLTFPAARSQALTEYFKNPRNFSGDDFDGVLTPLLNEVTQILNTPNNILGIEYCKALLRLNSRICPVTIRREGMGYHETTVPEGDSASSSPDLQSSTDFFASATVTKLFKSSSTSSATPCTALITSDNLPTPDGSMMIRSGLYCVTTSFNALPKSPTKEQQIHPEFISVTSIPASLRNPPSIPISPNSFSISTTFSPFNASFNNF